MLLVVSDLEIPRPLLALDPLSSHQRGQSEMFLVEFNVPHYGVQIGLGQGLSDLVLVQRTRPLQDIGRQLKKRPVETHGLCPLPSGVLEPDLVQFLARVST